MDLLEQLRTALVKGTKLAPEAHARVLDASVSAVALFGEPNFELDICVSPAGARLEYSLMWG